MNDYVDVDLVKITHYINPHMFWYKYEDSFFRNTELSTWENKLQQFFAKQPHSPTTTYRPKMNEVVAVYNFSFNRWIRAQCDDIVEFMIANTKYTVWAIDYGIPFQTESKWIRRLPKEVGELPEETVFFGGINNVIPAEKEFNFETFQSEVNSCSKWSPLAVRTIENLIYEAAHIRFVRHIVSKQGQYFGNLEFTSHTNRIIKADATLLTLNHAVKVDEFLKEIRQIGTNQIKRWQINDGTSFVSKYNKNKLSNAAKFERGKTLARMQKMQESVIDEEITRKVTDWTKRNEITRINDEDSVIDDEASVCGSFVSVKASRQIATNQLPIEDDPVMLKCGVYRKKQLEKYKQSIPPPPLEKSQEKASDKSQNQDEVVSVVSTPNSKEMGNKKDSNYSNKSESSVQTNGNEITSSAMSVVMKRLNSKRKSLQAKLASPQEFPQNAIPAGFDLRNLQIAKSVKDTDSCVAQSYVSSVCRNNGMKQFHVNGNSRGNWN